MVLADTAKGQSSLYLGVRAHYRGGLAAPVPLESNLWQKTAWVVRKPGLGMILHGNNVMEVVESYSIVSDNQVAKKRIVDVNLQIKVAIS